MVFRDGVLLFQEPGALQRVALQRLVDEVRVLEPTFVTRSRRAMSAPLESQPGGTSAGTETDKVPKGKHTMILHTVAFALGGAVLGFGYYKLVGCSSGACPITSNPYISTLFGAVMGFLAGGGMGK
jgi:hypothetical protein